MMNDWFKLRVDLSSNMPISEESRVVAEVSVPPEAVWFDGHFPSSPILPAVAQISLATVLLEIVMGRKICVSKVRRVRFKKIIQPNERLQVTITQMPPKSDPSAKSYEFQITSGGEAACSGFFECSDDAGFV